MSLHPYLSCTSDVLLRAIRAHYWLVADSDPTHTSYWRDQIAQCDAALEEAAAASSSRPDRCALLLSEWRRVAMVEGFRHGTRAFRVSVTINEGLDCG